MLFCHLGQAVQIVVSADERKSAAALARHMCRMRGLYGDVLPLSLVDQHVSTHEHPLVPVSTPISTRQYP
jgi:hypothetical protein